MIANQDKVFTIFIIFIVIMIRRKTEIVGKMRV